MPLKDTVVLTDSNTVLAAGVTMPFMICFTVATGVVIGTSTAGASRPARAPAIAKPMPATIQQHADEKEPMSCFHLSGLWIRASWQLLLD